MITLIDQDDEEPQACVLSPEELKEVDDFFGFNEDDLDTPVEIIAPTIRCKRCGSWLRINTTWADAPDGSPREYCELCDMHMQSHSHPCRSCGTRFFREEGAPELCPECEARLAGKWHICKDCGERYLPYTCNECKDHTPPDDVCFTCHWKQEHSMVAATREYCCKKCGATFLPRKCEVSGCEEFLIEFCPSCHEELVHDKMRATVWSLEDCPNCYYVIQALKADHRVVTEMSLEKLLKGEERDDEALVAYAMNDNLAPVVYLVDRFLNADEVRELITKGTP